MFAEYDGCNDSITLKQEKGSKSSYDYTLKFKNENECAVKSLTTSLPTEFSIPLISTTNLYIDGEYINSIPYYDLKFVKYDNWYDVSLDEDDDEISIIVHVIEPNESKDFDRETELEIYNANDVTNRIRLLIKQPKNKLFRSVYNLFVNGYSYFNVDTIKTSKIEFKPRKTDIYEDGTEVSIDYLENGFKIETEWFSSDNTVLEGRELKLVDFNGTHIMKPIYHHNEVPNDVTLCVNSWIVDNNGNKVTKTIPFDLTLQGVNITTYEYIFEFEDGSLYNELEWEDNDLNKKYINIVSKKQHYINGKFDCEYEIPFKYKLNDANLDANFSVFLYRTPDDTKVEKFYIYPNTDNYFEENIIKQYTLIQCESDKTLQLNLIQYPKSNEQHIGIELNIMVHCDDIGNEDYWTDEESIMFVTDITNEKNQIIVKEIPLNRCWLYHGIEENGDYVYNGNIDLIVGHKYNFKIDGFIAIKTNNGQISNITFNETYDIEDDDEGLDLIIEI